MISNLSAVDDTKLMFGAAGVAFDTPTTFDYDNEWWGENETRATELWDSIKTDLIAIAPTNDWVDSKGLQRSGDFESARFPWDPKRGLYFLKVYHQLHCLVGRLSCKTSPTKSLTRCIERIPAGVS